MKMYSYRIHWTQEVREQIEQDESRLAGHRRVEVVLNIVAPTRAIADVEANNRYRHSSSKPDIKIIEVTETDLHAVLTLHVMNHYTANGGLKGPEPTVIL